MTGKKKRFMKKTKGLKAVSYTGVKVKKEKLCLCVTFSSTTQIKRTVDLRCQLHYCLMVNITTITNISDINWTSDSLLEWLKYFLGQRDQCGKKICSNKIKGVYCHEEEPVVAFTLKVWTEYKLFYSLVLLSTTCDCIIS